MEGRSHWRNTGLPAKLFIFDARSVFPLLALLISFSMTTFMVAFVTTCIFYVIERFGMDFAMALRFVRGLLAGDTRRVLMPAERRLFKGSFKSRTLMPVFMLVAVFSVAPQSAMAAFEVVPDAGQSDCEAKCHSQGEMIVAANVGGSTPTIIHSGKRAIDEAIVEGFGTLPLGEFVGAILPPQWTYKFANEVDRKRFITWEGGKPWVDILEDVLKKEKLHARVDWERKQLFVITPEMAYNIHPTPKDGQQEADNRYRFTLNKGEELSDAIYRWAEQVNWDVAWSSEVDYPISHNVDLGTDFEEAVSKVISAYSDARTPLSVMFWTANKVLEVDSLQSRFKAEKMNRE